MKPPAHKAQKDNWFFSTASEALSASPIQHEDLWQLKDENTVHYNYEIFQKEWEKEMQKKKYSLIQENPRARPHFAGFVFCPHSFISSFVSLTEQ
jgi:hypothetical protein